MKIEKIETTENLSEKTHNIKENDLLTAQELKDLFEWFEGKGILIDRQLITKHFQGLRIVSKAFPF